jgi:hypothetical protein
LGAGQLFRDLVQRLSCRAVAAEHGRKNLAIISVVHDEPVDDASRYITDQRRTWPIIDDPHRTIAENYLVEALPESFLISRDVRIVAAPVEIFTAAR